MDVYSKPEPGIIAYTAGLFDGEGSVSKPTRKNASRVSLVQSEKNNGEYLINWLIEQWGIGHARRSERSNHLNPHFIMWEWTVDARRDALWFLENVLPYLIVKRVAALAAIENIKSTIDGKQRWTIWTENEDRYLRDNYLTSSTEQLSKALKRSGTAIQKRAQLLDIQRNGGAGWRTQNRLPGDYSPQEDEFIRACYGIVFAADIAEELKRPQSSIMRRAGQLGITSKRGIRHRLVRLSDYRRGTSNAGD